MRSKRTAGALCATAVCVLGLGHANCQRARAPQAGVMRAGSPQRTEGASKTTSDAPIALEPSWWREVPPWYRGLPDDQRAGVDRAQGLLENACRRWADNDLLGAESDLSEAERLCTAALGADHWMTWLCELHQALLEAQRQWDGQTRQRAAELALRPLTDENIRDAFGKQAQKAPKDEAVALRGVDEICQLLQACVDPRYTPLFEAYRARYRGQIAERCEDYAMAQQHRQEALLILQALTPAGCPPLEVRVRHELVFRLVQARATGRSLSSDEEQFVRTHLRLCLHSLHEQLPVISAYAQHWDAMLQLTGMWLRKQERYGEAKFVYDAATSICALDPNQPTRMAIHLLDLAEANNAIGDGYAALSILQWMDNDELRDTLSAASKKRRFLEERGFAYSRTGQYERACKDFEAALDIEVSAQGQDPGRVHYLYGAALTKRRQYNEAVAQYELAANSAGRSRVQNLSQMFRVRALVFQRVADGDYAGASSLLGELDDLRDVDIAGECRRQRLRGYVHLLQGQDEQAMGELVSAAEHYEQARSLSNLSPIDLASWHENESPYLLGAICALRFGQQEKAFYWLERHSGQALDLLTRAASVGSLGWPDVFLALGQDQDAGQGPEPLGQHTSAGQVGQPEPQWLLEVGASLLGNGDVAVVGWIDHIAEPGACALPDRWAFAVYGTASQPKLTFVRLADDPIQPKDVIEALTSSTSNQRWRRSAYQLYRHRFAPIMQSLEGVSRLYVLSRGAMIGFPVEILPVEDPDTNPHLRLLAERFTTSYGPSCSVLSAMRARSKRDANQYQLLAIGDVESAAPVLPASGVELRTVAAHFGPRARILAGLEASEPVLYSMSTDTGDNAALCDYSHLHFAVHGEADVLSPEQCYLQLSDSDRSRTLPVLSAIGTSASDGRLGFAEIMSLRLNASLVVLSACKTGLGRPLETEGYLGLPHAFFRAGARTLITTLWPVEDVSAAMLMDRFYANVCQKGMNEASALNEAKQHLRTRTCEDVVTWCKDHGAQEVANRIASPDLAYSHPMYWAPYVFWGPQD